MAVPQTNWSTLLRSYIWERGKMCRKYQKVRGLNIYIVNSEQDSLNFRLPLMKMGKSLQNIWRNLYIRYFTGGTQRIILSDIVKNTVK
jgi:hypothetical protein